MEAKAIASLPQTQRRICYTCGGANFWTRADGEKICDRCHPQPTRNFPEPITGESRPAVMRNCKTPQSAPAAAGRFGDVSVTTRRIEQLNETDDEGNIIIPYTHETTAEARQRHEAVIRLAQVVTLAPQSPILEKLKSARRLNDDVIQTFNIRPHKYAGQWGWIYDLPTGGERWKNATKDARPKYAWPAGSKPTGAALYYASDLLGAIEAARGILWLVTEADVWTLRAAGINNSLSTFSESIIPNDLGDMLLSMGVNHVLIAPDKDRAGQTFAQKVQAALHGSTIELTCYELPAQLGDKGDIGKAWQSYNQADPFGFWLMQLPRVEIEPPATAEPVTFSAAYFGDPLAAIRQEITRALNVYNFGADGFSLKNIPCLFHGDDDPSASLHGEKGLYCHTCSKWYTWKACAIALGIPWEFTHATTTSWNPASAVKPQNHIVGLSREARNSLITIGLTDLARVLDVIYHVRLTADPLRPVPDAMTLDEFTACLARVIDGRFTFKPYTIRKVFMQLQGKSLSDEGEFLRDFFPSFILQQEESKKILKNSKRGRKGEGRPRNRVTIPTEAELNSALGVMPTRYNWLSVFDLETSQQYRAECMAQPIRDRPGKYARAQIAAPLGISNPTIGKYCKLAGIIRTPQPPKLTELKPEEVIALPKDHKDLVLMRHQKQIKPNMFLQDERGVRHEYTQRGASQAAMMGGGKLYRAEYQASEYRPEDA